ncbi:MAG: L-histidine N(alpha)-methyltransferase [Candidatus Methylomirabilia bacterium]
MTSSNPDTRIQHARRSGQSGPFPNLAEDVRKGLTKRPKELPPKYLYDERGAPLFEQICELPEYYPSRTERIVLERIADELVAVCRPTTLVEFGPGNASKTRILLDAMSRTGLPDLYVPIDFSENLLEEIITGLGRDYPRLRFHRVLGDFERPVEIAPSGGPRLIIFLGGTIGNLTPQEAAAFLRNVACLLGPDDRFLLGTDLVKDVAVLERAYNDCAGVTAAFNRNMLSVINRNLGADFDLDRFEHLAFYNSQEARIEMHLVARDAHQVRIHAIDLVVDFAKGESIRTEISCKYTRSTVETMLAESGLRLLRWDTDDEHPFALSLSAAMPQDHRLSGA